MVSAGEASSDAHTELIVDCRDLAVIGIVDVLLNYHKFLKRLRMLRQEMKRRKPDILLLVDYPDFNLKLAATAKSFGIPVLFYVSPQVWAWRSGRVPKIGSLVSHMAVLFPFEVSIYEKHNIPVTYVGNPVVADAVSEFSLSEARSQLSINISQPVVTLLPGSRTSEILRNLPRMLQAAKIIEEDIPDCQFLLPIAPT